MGSCESLIHNSVMYVFGTWNFFGPLGALNSKGGCGYLHFELVKSKTLNRSRGSVAYESMLGLAKLVLALSNR